VAEIGIKKQKLHLHIDKSRSLMAHLLAANVPVASSCKGEGICGKCRVKVETIHGKLPERTQLETDTGHRNRLAPDERLSCQLFLENGKFEVDTSYW
jgi:2Fe-2S ferredoxin